MKSASMLWLLLCAKAFVAAQGPGDFSFPGNRSVMENMVRSGFQFNGYTNYWHDVYREWIHYGNLYKTAVPDIGRSILQSKVDIAADLGLPGLSLQEGFFSSFLAAAGRLLEEPSLEQIEQAPAGSDLVISVHPDSETGRRLTKDVPTWHATARDVLKSHQYGAEDFVPTSAFVLERGGRKLFVVSSADRQSRARFIQLLGTTKDILENYDLHKGWFGAKTLQKSVTCTPGHYLEVMGRGMDEGNDWFVFDGYMDFLAQKELDEWIRKVHLPVVADAGSPPIYGCENYDGLQVQANYTGEEWIAFAHERGGYAFGQVADTLPPAERPSYDGYIAYDTGQASGLPGFDGNKEQVDNEETPFICPSSGLHEDAIPAMVLFIKKQEALTKESLWDAILSRREVAVLEGGKMMGSAKYRQALGLLLLDRVFPEEYFADRIRIRAFSEGYTLRVVLTNTYPQAVDGTLEVVLPPELKMKEALIIRARLEANSAREMQFNIRPLASAMGKANPVALHFRWGARRKSTLAMLDLPRFISVHQLLYGHAPVVDYPVSIHNFSGQSSFPVSLEVSAKDNPGKIVYKSTSVCTAPSGSFRDLSFKLKLPPGNYNVKTSALGLEQVSQLGVGAARGVSVLSEVDLNGDGVNEYRMENDSVRITLLATGARVIEYIVRSGNDNVLFKLWPGKAGDDRRAYRKRGYYPFGGFEDFLGQASMETHKAYEAEILQSKGDYVRLKMTADYFGNRIEKIFTLYGNSPLLEVRFALTFKNPEANVLGPQPILELGKKHGTEDVFTVPGKDGLQEFIMEPERAYGRVLYLKEGWNAGYDTEEDISFVGAFPVTEPLFLHLWMNHPRNRDAHYYYAEFQPWTPIYQKTTMYFTYYLWGMGGHWQKGLDELRKRNLISTQ